MTSTNYFLAYMAKRKERYPELYDRAKEAHEILERQKKELNQPKK
jgi:hypothetical protein